uniref:Uncharacterized protein n=1 Tax=Anopheles epiroticus TaxID=199890 RepID=A0A182P0W1_9DIPT
MMSCRRSIASSGDGACDVNNNSQQDGMLSADNLLRLALKKPKSWKWELTTSSSSPNISFPKIQLFDGASGELMVEVDRPDCVIRSTDGPDGVEPSSRYRRSRTSLVKEKLSTSGDSLADIFNQLQNKGLGHKLSTSGSQYRLLNGEGDESRGALQKSKSANAIVPALSDLPTVTRRRSRRSLASRSSSILERISEFYGRSSTEEEDCQRPDLQLVVPPAVPQLVLEPASDDVPQPEAADSGGVTIEELPSESSTAPIKPRPKIYKLVRSNIGTLMVREESFHTQRSLRRRQREGEERSVMPPPPSQELVELDEHTDRPKPLDVRDAERYRYEREISHIDRLLSRVMLSHDLQTEELPNGTGAVQPVEVVENGLTPHQNGTHGRRRRSRRSASVGGSVTSQRSSRSISTSRRYNGGHRSASSSDSTSEGEQDASGRSGQQRSSRSGSQKRRGRTRHRDPSATISNGKCGRSVTT